MLALLFLTVQAGSAQMMVLYIADTKAYCLSPTIMQCLQVKEKPTEPYSLFYSPIDGFDYEEGYSYKLEVMKTVQLNPVANSPVNKYYLVRVVEKEKAVQEKTRAFPIPNHTLFYLGKINRNGTLTNTSNEKVPDIYFDLKTGNVSGNNGCNRYFGKAVIRKENIEFKNLASTRMACPNNKTELLYMKLLAATNRFVMQDRVLKLMKDRELLLEFYIPMK